MSRTNPKTRETIVILPTVAVDFISVLLSVFTSVC
jgi:hypothetical protein